MRHLKLFFVCVCLALVCASVYYAYGAGIQGTFQLTVATPTPAGTFAHFSNTGVALTTYTPGSSIFPRSQFMGYYANSPYYSGTWNNYVADVQAAAFNASEQGSTRDPVQSGCLSTNFALGPGAGTGTHSGGTGWQTNECGNWHDAMANGFVDPILNGLQNAGLATLVQIDNWRPDLTNQSVIYSCGSTIGSCIANWPQPAITDWRILLQQHAATNHDVIAQIGPDEFGEGGQECGTCYNAATNPYMNAFVRDFGLEGSGQPHVILGWENLLGDTTNQLSALHSDHNVLEVYSGQGTWASLLGDFHRVDSQRAQMVNARGPLPLLVLTSCNGPSYIRNNDTQFRDGIDTIVGVRWAADVGAGFDMDLAMFAVVHGYAGSREYAFDGQFAGGRAIDPNGTSEQTGCSPISAATTTKISGLYTGLGQDRWYASSAAYNMIKQLEPYVFMPTMAAPNQAQACDSDASVSTAGDPILCGARSGNGGRLVFIENVSSSSRTFAFNPASYVFASGTAQSWKVIGSTDGSCGAQTTLPSVSDCIKGGTQVIGATTVNPWTAGSTWPAAGTAPTTTGCGGVGGTFAGGVCTLSMQPTEVDAFLYHQ